MDAPRLDPAFTPTSPQPSLWGAIGLIALYFIMQFVVGTAIGLLLGLVLGAGLGHGAVPRVQALLSRPDVNALMVMPTLVIAALLTLFCARRLWPALWRGAEPPGLGFASPRQPQLYYALAMMSGIALPFLGGLLTQWLAQGHEVSQDIKDLGALASPALRVPLALLVVSLGPLVEELLFRGVLLSAMMRFVPASTATAASALLFACVHLPDLNFLWYALPNLMLLGVVLAWLRLRSGSIWPAVLAHAVNNALAVVSWFVAAT
jgi:membrane protease YdiL (CAAX protease family)